MRILIAAGVALACALTTTALADVGGGSQVFSNWFATGAPVTISATTASSQVALSSIGPTARICNTGLNDAYVAFGTDSSVVATSAGSLVKAGSCQAYNLKPFATQYTNAAGITSTGTTTLRVETGVGSPLADGALPPSSAPITVNSLVVGAPTGGDEGTGTVNATGLYQNGTAVSIAGGSVSSSTVTATNGTTANTLADIVGKRILSVADFGAIDTAAHFTAALNAAIAACNAGTINAFALPRGIFNLTAEPTAFLPTASCTEYVNGATLQFPNTVSSAFHAFVTIGSDSVQAANVNIIGPGTFSYQNSPTANGYAFVIPQAANCSIQNILLNGAASVMHLGNTSASGSPSKCRFVNIKGDINNGLNDNHNLFIEAGANITFDGWNFTGTGTCNTNAAGALIKVAAAAGKLVDTLRRTRFGMQCYDGTDIDGTGKPYGEIDDVTAASMENWWTDQSFLDHTTTCTLMLQSSGGGTGILRNLAWSNERFTPDAGRALCTSFLSGAFVRDIRFNAPRIFDYGTLTPVQIQGSNIQNFSFNQPQVDFDNAGTRPAAFEVDSDGVTIADGWSIGSANGTNAGVTYALVVGDASVNDLYFGCGNYNGTGTLTALVSEPTYTTTNSSQRKICKGANATFPTNSGNTINDIVTMNGTGSSLKDSGKAIPSGTVVGTTDSQTLTNKTLTAPIIGTITNTGTLTLPTATDTLVGKATTDTLTNKSISGSTNTLTNIPNSALPNSGVTPINGTNCTLGSACTLTLKAGRLGGMTVATAANSTAYLAASGSTTTNNQVEATVNAPEPIAGTYKNLRFHVRTAPGTGNTDILTLRIGGSSAALTCTIQDTATDCTDLVNSAPVTAGQLTDWQITTSASATVSQLTFGAEFDIP